MVHTKRQVELFNGQPLINVRKGKDGIYRFATIKHACFDLRSRPLVEEFMKRHGYKCVFTLDPRPLSELV